MLPWAAHCTNAASAAALEEEIPSCNMHVTLGFAQGRVRKGVQAARTAPAPAFPDADFAGKAAVLQMHGGNQISA